MMNPLDMTDDEYQDFMTQSIAEAQTSGWNCQWLYSFKDDGESSTSGVRMSFDHDGSRERDYMSQGSPPAYNWERPYDDEDECWDVTATAVFPGAVDNFVQQQIRAAAPALSAPQPVPGPDADRLWINDEEVTAQWIPSDGLLEADETRWSPEEEWLFEAVVTHPPRVANRRVFRRGLDWAQVAEAVEQGRESIRRYRISAGLPPHICSFTNDEEEEEEEESI